MNFYTLFTRTENVHLLKDVGMIPESLARKFDNINSYIVTYKNGDYPYLGQEIKYTKLVYINKRFGKYIDGIRFIRKYSKKIDILNIYHLNLSSFIYCIFCKIFLKKEAIIYLKLDVCSDELTKLRKRNIKSLIKRLTIKMADLVTGESSLLVEQLQNEVDSKIIFLPNGYYDSQTLPSDYQRKKNRIITVGRLGTYQKNTELLIDAFLQTQNKHDWELRLIGPYTEKIKQYICELQVRYPALKDRLCLIGEIKDKKQLSSEYAEAKIFALPSKFESFGLVLTEALKAGDYIITSDHVPASYDIIYDESAGQIVKSDTVHEWSNAILECIETNHDWNSLCNKGFQVANNHFSWDNIAGQLYLAMDKLLNNN